MSTNNFSRVGVAAVLFISLAIYRGSKENENIPISSLNQKTEKSSIVKYYLDTTIIWDISRFASAIKTKSATSSKKFCRRCFR